MADERKPIRDCYPCDGKGWWRTSSTQFTYRCNNCGGSGVSPTWEMSDGSDASKRPKAA
jgi:DnaJ-class molecular chaperone